MSSVDTLKKEFDEKLVNMEKRILAMETHLRKRYEYSRRNGVSVLETAIRTTSRKVVEEFVEGTDSAAETIPRDETFAQCRDLLARATIKWPPQEADRFHRALKEIFYGPDEPHLLTGKTPGDTGVIDITAEEGE